MVAKRVFTEKEYVPYSVNPSIVTDSVLLLGEVTITTGEKLKIKNLRGTYTFIRVATNLVLDASWIDCMEDATGTFRSFKIEQISRVFKPRKARKKSG